MASIQVTERVPCSAEAVWAVIGDFGGLHRWHPLVQRLDLSWEGRIRTLHYADGARTVERLEARNDAARRYDYVLVNGSLPLHMCRSRLQADADGTHCRVIWCSEFDALGDGERATAVRLRAIYRAGLGALADAVAIL